MVYLYTMRRHIYKGKCYFNSRDDTRIDIIIDDYTRCETIIIYKTLAVSTLVSFVV